MHFARVRARALRWHGNKLCWFNIRLPHAFSRTCNQSTRFGGRLSWISSAVLLPLLLLQWTITSSPARHGRSSSHSWLHSWLRLPIGLSGCNHAYTFVFFLFSFGFLRCSIVFGHFVKINSDVMKCKYLFNAQKVRKIAAENSSRKKIIPSIKVLRRRRNHWI